MNDGGCLAVEALTYHRGSSGSFGSDGDLCQSWHFVFVAMFASLRNLMFLGHEQRRN